MRMPRRSRSRQLGTSTRTTRRGGGHVCQSCILGGAAELPRLRRENDALLKKAQTLQQQVHQAVAQLKQQQRDASAAQRRLQAELEEVEKRRGKTEAQMHDLRRQLVQKELVQKELAQRLLLFASWLLLCVGRSALRGTPST